jgi:epoxyqueuosine reductase
MTEGSSKASADQPAAQLIEMAESRGWQARVVPVGRLADLARIAREWREGGLVDADLDRERFRWFVFERPDDLAGARSIVVVAVPTPQMRVVFHWRGERVRVIIPPTYVGYDDRSDRTRQAVAAWMSGDGYRVASAKVPLKTLAVRSGLAEYGRNNVTYVAGLGSFVQLVAALTDMPPGVDPWREPKALDRCATCVACVRACPARAITEDRFLIRAERCLTYLNESAREFPAWVDPAWHHCLMGCTRCQLVCPENRRVRGWVEECAEFSDEETALLLDRVPFDRLPGVTAAKVGGLGMSEDYALICRNLSMVLPK